MPAVPTFSDCRGATAMTRRLPNDQVTPGTHLCMRTSSGAYAYIGIAAVDDADDDLVTVDVTVWGS
jgi:hypothetical protein